MARHDAEEIFTQMRYVVVKMRSITPDEGEMSQKQQEELRRLYDEEIVPLTGLAKELVDDG